MDGMRKLVKEGSLTLRELFDAAERGDESGDMLAKLKVVSVLESLPGVGKVRARHLMSELEISESRRLRGLGTNQRRALLERRDQCLDARLAQQQRRQRSDRAGA